MTFLTFCFYHQESIVNKNSTLFPAYEKKVQTELLFSRSNAYLHVISSVFEALILRVFSVMFKVGGSGTNLSSIATRKKYIQNALFKNKLLIITCYTL